MNKIKWNDISHVAKSIFTLWMWGQDLAWAEVLWSVFDKNGLTTYSNELERHKVLIRLLTLAGMYDVFCYNGWDERLYLEYSLWANELELSAFRLGQLLGNAFEANEDDIDSLFEMGVIDLVHAEHQNVYECLKKHYGNDWAILIAFAKSNHDSLEEDIDDDDILDGLLYTQQAYSWIAKGMPL